MTEFENILSRIVNGEHIAPSELLPYLCLESKKQRCQINYALAEAYFQIETKESLEQAKVFVQRAWELSGFSAEVLPFYIKICKALDDIADIREAYKRLGMKMAAEGNISDTIRYFDLWQYSYAHYNSLDKYEYDFDIMDCMDRLAEPHRFIATSTTEPSKDKKIRLAYLLKGITELNSVLIKIKLLFAKYHDKSRFEISFFVPESESLITSSLQGCSLIKHFESCGFELRIAPNVEDTGQRLLGLAQEIYESKPDILVTSASLANFSQYFITTLKPAPLIIGFNQGPQPQFVSPNLDWCITWAKHPLIDCMVDCSLATLETDLPNRDDIVTSYRKDFNIPEDGLILFSGGRKQKFQEPEFWKSIVAILSKYSNAYYIAVGVEQSDIHFLSDLMQSEVEKRMRFHGWTKDYLTILAIADVVVDTYPSGGGIILIDAMALGIPVVSFENNYLKPFDQTNWSLAEEHMNVPYLIATRGDFEQFKRIISRLIEDKGYRTDMAHRCKESVIRTHGNPERMVRRCEEIYTEVFENKQREYISVDNIRSEKANDFEEAAINHSTEHDRTTSLLPSTGVPNTASQKTVSFSQHTPPTPEQYADKDKRCGILYKEITGEVSALTPRPKEFILRESRYKAKKAKVLYSRVSMVRPFEQGLSDLFFVFSNKGKTWENTRTTPYTDAFKEFLVVDPETKEDLLITAKDIYNSLRQGYDFSSAYSAFQQNRRKENTTPRVAFTVLSSSFKGGGTIVLFNYVNWLSELGVDVAVYSDEEPPDWIDVKGRFYYIPDTQERYAAISEEVIIVYSILELQHLLYCCDTKNKVIYHLCQGIDEYHYCTSTYTSLMAPKTIFEFLFSLPVGRLAVSPHIQDYFRKNYNQTTHNIFNGIDLDCFTPKPKKTLGKNINILSIGRPSHTLKGKADITIALDLMANARPDLNFSLILVSGEKKTNKGCFGSNTNDFTCETLYYFGTGQSSFTCTVKYGLSQEQMRQFYYSSDIYINSSWYEGFGLPPIEAMACGVPLIQADNQGLDGVAIDKKNCLLIPPNNPQKMAKAIETLIKNDILRNNLIENGIETANRFSKEKQHKMFITEFEKILHCKFDVSLTDTNKHEPNIEHMNSNTHKSYKLLFSVLVPTYNQAKYLPETLDSLINQTYDNWEAIVVDDGSTDETAKVMEQYAQKDSRIRTFHKNNGGVGSALNYGLQNARGHWIYWLSSDDLFERNKLHIHLQAIEENPEIRFFHTHYSVLHEQTGKKGPAGLNIDTFIPPIEMQVLKFFEINYFNGISIAIHRDIFEQVGNFKEEFRAGQDFDMWLRISALYRSHFINRQTCVTRIHPTQGTDFSAGTVLHDSPGIFDSARACLDFLNNHEFPLIFPTLDLSITEHALCAIKNTLRVVVNPLSFINRCGYAPALMDRLYEWITNFDSTELKSLLSHQLIKTISHIQKTDLSEEIKMAFKLSPGILEKSFRYKSYDPINHIAEHSDRLETAGEHKRAVLLRQYLAEISNKTEQNVSVKNQPLFTVLVPAYNQAKYLPEALDSILNQTYDNWEAIVVNDGSTDETAEVMKRYTKKDSRIRIFHKDNGGVASALNEGLRNARGEWICWLSSDDFFEPDKLKIHLQYIKENPHIHFFNTNYLIYDEKIGTKCTLKEDPRELVSPAELQILKFFERNCANGISVAIHREVFDHVGWFNEKYRYGQDFEMWLRINANYRRLFIDYKSCVTRWHTGQETSKFPEGGFYDSSHACIEFLNSHKFSEYFPLLDLTVLDEAVKAIKETLAVVLNLNAMMYKCYFNTVLLERLCEWISQECPKNLKQIFLPHLESVINEAIDSQLPEEIKTALFAFRNNIENDFHFRPHDFTEEAAEYAQKLLSAGHSERAESIKRYLSLINPGSEKTGIRSNLEYWKQCQDNEYFEKHPCYNGLIQKGKDHDVIKRYMPLSKEMDVVVIGCGYGRDTLNIAPNVKHVYGIDVNRTILDKADRFLAERGVTNFTSVLAEEWKDIIPDGIDLVYSIVVFQHLTRDLVKDYIFGLTEKLSQNGKFLCQFCESGTTYDSELNPSKPPNVAWIKTEIEELIKKSGLNQYSIDTDEVLSNVSWHWAFFGKQITNISKDTQKLQLSRQNGNLITNAASGSNVVSQEMLDNREDVDFQSSTNKPLVSIIMPAYNAADFIAEALKSVLHQNYDNFELIVVDDGSTDSTKDIIAGFNDNKIRYFYKENAGPASARNFGIKESQGTFLIHLDSDDMMTPDFVVKHLQEFEKHPEADLVYCDDYLIEENSTPIRVIKRPEYINTILLIRDLFHNGFPIVPFRTCFRRSVLDKIGLFDEELLVGEDYDMIRRFVRHGLKMHHLQDALYLRRMTSDSLSRNFSAQKAKCHFEVIRRFTDTFTYDELFPDVAWDKMASGTRRLHAKCLTAGTYLAIGQEYIKSNALEYSRTAFDRACSELNDCIKMDPENQGIQQLLQKSKRIRARYTKAEQQAIPI